jgi:tetratricopeptide (TPR) repeat protein
VYSEPDYKTVKRLGTNIRHRSRILRIMNAIIRFSCNWRFVLSAAAFSIIVAAAARCHSQTTLDAASTALKEGNYKQAEAYYREALAQSPQSPEVLSNLGIALQLQGKSSEAVHAFEKALSLKQMPLTYALLAEEKCKTRDLDGARPMIARILREDAKDTLAFAAIAPCGLDLDDPVDSVRVYSGLLNAQSYPPDLALIQLSKAYLKVAQSSYARLTQAPDKGVYILALQEAKQKGSPGARGAFDAAQKASPYFQPNLDFFAAVARSREHPQDSALLYLVEVLSSEQSMRQVQTCGESYPDSPFLAKLEAQMYADQGHDDEAVARYQALMQTHPELPDLLYNLGMLFRREREWDKALNVFQKQLARDPDDERSAARISESLIQLGRWKDLQDYLAPRVRTKDAPLWAMLDYAQASKILNEPKQAIVVLVNAEQSNPGAKEVHWRLMQLYRVTGDSAQAGKELALFRALSK